MKGLRILLLPFGWCYGLITAVRNSLYNNGTLSSYEIPRKSIVVGNLSAGGTGKTPLVEYILAHFKNKVPTSALSRGYGRSTTGVLIGNSDSTSAQIGDEPLLYQQRHGDSINVVVAKKRKLGVNRILSEFPNNQLIVLDDAFQHRAVKAGLNIIVTPFNDLYTNDFVLPAGNLREFRSGAKRADIVLVSKCPSSINQKEKDDVIKKLNFHNSNVFFSSIGYKDLIPFKSGTFTTQKEVLLVTGIGNPKPLIDHLSRFSNVTHMAFKDHHDFTRQDIDKIHDKFGTFASREKIIVTTEKDFMRLKNFKEVFDESIPWFYQPIEIKIDREKTFNELLEKYVGKF